MARIQQAHLFVAIGRSRHRHDAAANDGHVLNTRRAMPAGTATFPRSLVTMAVLAAASAASARAIGWTFHDPSTSGCASDLGCSLNGRCIGSACVCSKAWRGEHCDTLDLADRPDPGLGYHGSDSGGRLASWGAAPLRDAGGLYHAIISEMAGGVGLKMWICASRVVHATSPDPLTVPFRRQRVLFGPFAHEPRCVALPTGGSAFVCFFAYNPIPD
eukprot:gene8535-7794_t